MKNFITVLIQRIKSDNPEFFQKLQRVAVWVMLGCAVVYGALYLDIVPVSPEMHEKLVTACYAVGTFFLSTFFTSMVPTKDPNLVSPDTKQAIEEQKEQEEN